LKETCVSSFNTIHLFESVSPTLISNITSFIQSVLTTRGQAYGNVSNDERVTLINPFNLTYIDKDIANEPL
ncbi:hypothetical protein ACLBSN_33060, partial [Klebsiella pneumoniae]